MSFLSSRLVPAPAIRWLLAVAAATVVSIVAAPSASAYSGCWGRGPVAKDPFGPAFSTKWCHNYRSGYTTQGGSRMGLLYAGINWFKCQKRFPGATNPPVGKARNDWWLWTQADVGYAAHGWGWFPATYVSGGVNYGRIPNLPTCP